MFTNTVLQDNTYNASSLSVSLSAESRNKMVNVISKMLENVQKVLLHYNKAFNFSIQSLSTQLHDYSLMQHNDISPSVWNNTLNHIQTCVLLQDKMWKDMLRHKTAADSELLAIHQHINQLQQQKFILINHMHVNTFRTAMNTITIPQTQITQPQLPHVQSSSSLLFLHNNVIENSQIPNTVIANATATETSNIHPINSSNRYSSDLCNSSGVNNDLINVAKKKRKRRGYNGPYSMEEKQFMIDFYHQNKCETTKDIICLSDEMEKRFKVRRSPYGLAQKMYQMNVINSRLKALFQRQFEDESKERIMLNDNDNKGKNRTDTQSNDSHSFIKRKPFMMEEVEYIQELIIKYNNENSRKLYWRFLQQFVEWKNDSKSYQRFYHKYWTLINEQKNKTGASAHDNECSIKNERKRPYHESHDAVNVPCKRFKSSCNENKD